MRPVRLEEQQAGEQIAAQGVRARFGVQQQKTENATSRKELDPVSSYTSVDTSRREKLTAVFCWIFSS